MLLRILFTHLLLVQVFAGQVSFSQSIQSDRGTMRISLEPMDWLGRSIVLKCGELAPSVRQVPVLTSGPLGAKLLFSNPTRIEIIDLPVGSYQFRLYTLSGNLVSSSDFSSVEHSTQILLPVSGLARGSYVLQLNGPLTLRTIISR